LEAYSLPYDEYTEVEDPYQMLETKATDSSYTHLDLGEDKQMSKK